MSRVLLPLFILTGLLSSSAHKSKNTANLPPFRNVDSVWVDSVLNTLTLDEQIGQLFMVAAYSNKRAKHEQEISKLVKKYHIGGLIFFQGGPVRQAHLTNRYQEKAKVPLLISMDAEWGLAMRLDSTIKYPRQMLIGAIENDSLIYRLGEDLANQCKRLGVHINFAPVVDVNNNPSNPVINSRSFGENQEVVAKKGVAYMKGMQDHHVLAVAKHFPGHGDTKTDSHKGLPVIKHDLNRLEQIEFMPFKQLIHEGVGGMMVAHLHIPVLDSTKNQASTLSKSIVKGLLKEKMGYKGLIFTDALNMKGVAKYYKPGEVDLKAFLAGNDVLLFSEDVPTAINKIKQAIKNGLVSKEEVKARCRKILQTKKWVGLDNYKPVETKKLVEDLTNSTYQSVHRSIVAEAITVVHDSNNLLPLKRLDTLKIGAIAIGGEEENTFHVNLKKYANLTAVQVSKKTTTLERQQLKEKLEGHNLLLISIHGTNRSPSRKFGITNETWELVEELKQEFKVVLIIFGNPYAFGQSSVVSEVEALVCSYEDTELTQKYAAEVVFGGIASKGILPVSVGEKFKAGAGIKTKQPIRLSYGVPNDVGIDQKALNGIDSIAFKGISKQAYPGCQILVAKDGKVIYDKVFGHFTYEEKEFVKPQSIYDIASITKITASVSSLMKLQSEGKIHLDSTLLYYLPELVKGTKYESLSLREILAHQAGLKAWIPFYLKTTSNKIPRYDVYSLVQNETYPFRVAEDIYIHKNYPDSLYKIILNTALKKRGEYVYSDLGYYFMKKIVEKQAGVPLEQYVDQSFYSKLGMTRTSYRPLEKFKKSEIVPTEYDLTFRRQLIQGDVHDPGAAMLGGVGGHAGLFSTTHDLAIFMQMLLQGGEYGGERLISEEVIKEYTKCQYCANPKSDNRRGAGFDKPVRDGDGGPTCNCVSYSSFGHSGFTGTITWADPDEDVIFVFLSNRIYPNANNKKLIKMGIRTDIMQVIYDAIDQ